MKITFFGGAGEVGRSCILVSSGSTKILLDAGIKLGKQEEKPQIPDSILGELDGIFLSHAHLDHVAYLPHIFSAGYKGPVHSTKPTMELSAVIVSDYMRLSEPKDVTKEGLNRLRKSFKIHEFREVVTVKNLKVMFIQAGHIIGSSMIIVDDGKNRLIYSGDANMTKTRLLNGADTKNLSADTLIVESTYGSKKDVIKTDEDSTKKAMQSMKDTILAGGKVLIPAFAVGRAQEVLFMLDDYMNSGLLPKAPIYVDGMINKAMRIYRHNVIYCRDEVQKRILMSDYDPFRSPNFVPIEGKGIRGGVIKKDEGCIIVTTSGMMTGGPIISYLAKLGANPANKLVIVGYQAVGTPGREILSGAKTVKVENTTIHINMPVETYHLTAHADRRQLDAFISKIRGLKNVFLVHGEITKLTEFKDDLSGKYKAHVPEIGVEYTI